MKLQQLLRVSANFINILLVPVLLTTVAAFGQDKEKIKYLTPTAKGSTGFFNLYGADTPRRGEVSLALSSTHFNREPGDLDFTFFPVSLSVGLHDRLEFFFSWEAQRRVHAEAVRVARILPGEPLLPAQLENGLGTTAYFNDAPFLDVDFGSGPGELWTGFKLNILSEQRGSPLSLSLQPVIKIPGSRNRNRLLRGMTNGVVEGGYDLIVSKNLPAEGTLTGNYGYVFAGDPEGVRLQDRLNYGLGYERPLAAHKVRLIAELVGTLFLGNAPPGANARSPVDAQVGLRFWLSRWLSFSGAYSLNLRSIGSNNPVYGVPATDRAGWFVQLAFHRKINRPPSVECVPPRAVVEEGKSITIRVTVTDPDDDFLTLTWRTPVGTISQSDGEAVFDASGVRPGTYSILAEIGDGEHVVSCTTDVTVR